MRSSGAARNSSPASGTDDRPSTSTGIDGLAVFTWLPLSSIIARTRPHAAPATIGSPTLSSPLSTSTVATGPRPLSRLASSTMPLARPVGLALEVFELGDHEQLIEQVVDAELLGRRHLDDDRVAAPRLGHELVLGELAEHALRVGVVLVDLVDRDHDRHLGGAGVVDRLDRLRHDAVVGGDDEHDDVGRLGAACPHLRERGVAGRVDERDRLTVAVDLVGADVLGDATRLAGDDVGGTDLVEHGGLAVVDVAHDRDDRRARGCSSSSSSSSLSSNIAWSSTSCSWPGSTSSRSAPSSSANNSMCSSDSAIVAVTISPCWSRNLTTSAAVRLSLGPNSWAETPRSTTIVPSGTGASLDV